MTKEIGLILLALSLLGFILVFIFILHTKILDSVKEYKLITSRGYADLHEEKKQKENIYYEAPKNRIRKNREVSEESKAILEEMEKERKEKEAALKDKYGEDALGEERDSGKLEIKIKEEPVVIGLPQKEDTPNHEEEPDKPSVYTGETGTLDEDIPKETPGIYGGETGTLPEEDEPPIASLYTDATGVLDEEVPDNHMYTDVTGVLSDPTLNIYSGETGVLEGTEETVYTAGTGVLE